MSLRAMLTDPVTVVSTGPGSIEYDDLGRPVEVPGAQIRTSYRGRLYLDTSRELGASDDVVVDAWTLILPPEAKIAAGDRVESEGRVFDVVGTPDPKRTPRGLSHTTTTLRYVGGTS